jgi:hypothetical protein
MRPPNTSALSRNQPQPTATPATTSVNQCTPSRAREAATANVINAANPAATARPRRDQWRATTKAKANHAAAAADE